MIRPAVPTDFAAIDAFDPFAGDRAREIAEGRMLVAAAGGAPAAYVSWLPEGLLGRDYVTFLCVAPAARRRGLARALLRAVEARLAPTRLFISTEADNSPMLALLDEESWTPAGSIEGANMNGQPERYFRKDLAASAPQP